MADRQMRQLRTIDTTFQTREDESSAPHISGYFAVFNSDYDMLPGVLSESIAPGAFNNTLNDDIRALTNHDTTLVLGRTTAGTLQLRVDDHGLFGDITINPNDRDAMNTWERVKRGDVSQCSIGFEIVDEVPEPRSDGSTHWTIREIRLYEVSVCTFPAYEDTAIKARQKDAEELKRRAFEARKMKIKEGLHHGNRRDDAQEEDRPEK